MKKIFLYTITVCSCIVILATIIGSVWIRKQLFLDGFFKDWVSQGNIPNYSMHRTVFYCENNQYDIYNIESTAQEIFCINDSEIFFVHTKNIKDDSNGQLWGISSVNIETNKKTLWYSGIFTLGKEDYIEYKKLSQYSDITSLCGGMINGDNIYLKDSSHTVSFNIKTKEVNEDAQMPLRRYEWTVVPNSYIEITNKENKSTVRIEKEQFFEKNEYANRLKELNNKKTISRYGFCDEFFCKVMLVEEKIYIVCEVFNFIGDAFAIVFEYESESDTIKYILNKRIGTRVFNDFVLTN